jgi:hypothetical protein
VKSGIKDITGQRFGYLVAIEPTDRRQGSNVIWRFQCDCGSYTEKVISCLSDGSNCGCLGNEALRRKNLIPGVNDLVTLRPDLVSEWDYEKNGLKRPENRTVNSSDKVYWKCPQGHPSYLQVIANRTIQNQGCPYCSHNKVVPGETDLATLRPDLLYEWDYEKNSISPSEVTSYSKTEVYWKCEEGHSYLKAVRDRVAQVYGCPYCANKKRVLANQNDLASQYPERIRKEWDFEKNTIDPSKVTAWDRRKVWWKCEREHSYQQQIDNHIKVGQGCPYCTNKKVLVGFNDVATTHPGLVIEWDESNTKRPEECIAGSHQSIRWRCKDCGNTWNAAIKSRAYSKQGCPRCAFAYKSSEPEQVLFYYLRKIFPKAVNSYKTSWLGRMEIDVFIPEINAGIELDGGKWHRNISRDIKKTAILREHGITLFRLRDERNPMIVDGSVIIRVSRDVDKSIVNMEPYVQLLFDRINQMLDMAVVPDINIRRDLAEIQGLFDTKKKGKSVASDRQKMSDWNWEKNTINPEHIGVGSNRDVWWKCSLCGKEWLMPPHRKKGIGCEQCKRSSAGYQRALDKADRGETRRLSEFLQLMEEWDYEKNIGIDPTRLTQGSYENVWWKCKTCGFGWRAVVKSRARQGQGCRNCYNMRRGEHVRKWIQCVETGEEFLGIKETARKFGVSAYMLKQCLRKPERTVAGFHWREKSR